MRAEWVRIQIHQGVGMPVVVVVAVLAAVAAYMACTYGDKGRCKAYLGS
jgi:apolipoprotein N-acyltransferase